VTECTPNAIICTWPELRRLAEAADLQMSTGPREWPGQPSRQRLELFLAASPRAVLALLDELDALAAQLNRMVQRGASRRRRVHTQNPIPDDAALTLFPDIPSPRSAGGPTVDL
jgi:HAMP domain-containing protein